MSWQATEAVRDHSEARGATLTVAMMLASHAHPDGSNVYVGLDRLCKEAKVTRTTAVVARRWLLEHGEIEQTGTRNRQGKRQGVPIYSFAPLISKGLVSGPLDDGGVQSIHTKGPVSRPLMGPVSEPAGVQSEDPKQKLNRKSLEMEGEAEETVTLPSAEVQKVWNYYVSTMSPRRTQLSREKERIIDAAIEVASVEDCCRAIDGCMGDDWQMKTGKHLKRDGPRYNRLEDILGPVPQRGRMTPQDSIDYFLDQADEADVDEFGWTKAERTD